MDVCAPSIKGIIPSRKEELLARKSHKETLLEIDEFVGKEYPGTSLVVLGFAGRDKRGRAMISCYSKSRGFFTADWGEVKRGHTKGTTRGESRIRRNKYDILGNEVKVYFNNSDLFFICDIEDIDTVISHTWHLNSNRYARSTDKQYFHQLIMGKKDGLVIDHINQNKLDNRKKNLRICEYADNSHNRKKYFTNTTGHTGVTKTRYGKYNATIICQYKKINLGNYDMYEDACKAYDDAKIQYHTVTVNRGVI